MTVVETAYPVTLIPCFFSLPCEIPAGTAAETLESRGTSVRQATVAHKRVWLKVSGGSQDALGRVLEGAAAGAYGRADVGGPFSWVAALLAALGHET